MNVPTIRQGLIVEDIPETMAWLESLLRQCFPGISIVQADTCSKATSKLDSYQPDIAVIDLGLPDGSGADLIPLIKSRTESCQCIVTTIFDDDRHVFTALKNGADGYMTKDREMDELCRMLQGINQGQPPLSPAIARKILGHFQQSQDLQTPPCQLTAREKTILQHIAKGYTVARTADMTGITYNTAASYVKEIYRKLNISSRAEAATAAMRLGLIVDEPKQP